MPTIADLDTPAVLIDIDRVEANLQRAQAHATEQGYALRPHIKTHKLPRFAQRQVELGAVGITVQKLGEAEVMADAGLADIFLPYNILGARKLARLKALNERVTLSVTADSPDTLFGYAATFTAGKPLTVLIECDSGGGRCGVQTPAQALALARQIALAPGLRFGGLMTYPPLHGVEKSNAWLSEAVALFEQAGIAVPRVSSGNSPDMWAPAAAPVTERRPGTYIYYDRFQVKERAAGLDDCALSVLVTVVSRPTATRAVIDAGSKSLTSDLLGMEGFGLVMGTDLTVKGLSEEHGVIELPVASDWPRVGERLRIIPNHACVISNLFDSVTLISGDEVREVVPVAARGRVD
ncbi:alanine racemase [Devosia insulae DS-56]|uniref:Alanine racemase n=1 Tax=Devosia insulae DS-56 TaxID=1116389 RepID=A0A1E5XJS5_9HYPH|nr:D-TA family PLP-dependent enzyme [Devosia insulae]OEO28847.1 alanine racemase [Devosia insulae DS-56]